MVMSFFRRGDDKIGARTSYDSRSVVAEPRAFASAGENTARGGAPDISEYEALGTAMEVHKQSSGQLLSSLSSLQSGMSSLIEDHGQTLQEIGELRADQSRLEAILQQESAGRAKVEEDNSHLVAENRDMASELAQLRIEADTFRQEFVKLQALHQVVSEERMIYEARLFDAEDELRSQIKQYDEASLLMTRAQQELDSRSRELAMVREKLENETTAHQLLAESAQREASTLTRELSRITDERNHLKIGLGEHEAMVRSLQISVGNARQELSAHDDRYKRLETEFENLQSSSALERAQMASRHEAMNSKVMLAEKLLATANGRNRVTDDELHEAKAELKRLKTDYATLTSRSERTNEELARARAIGSESEAARRELAGQSNNMTARLRDAEETRARREREIEIFKRDMDARAESDRFEIGQLRTSLDIASTEARQLKTDNAILTGQLEAARHDRSRNAGSHVTEVVAEEPEWAGSPAAVLPIIEISEAALLGKS